MVIIDSERRKKILLKLTIRGKTLRVKNFVRKTFRTFRPGSKPGESSLYSYQFVRKLLQPLEMLVSPGEPVRINILIPEMEFRHVFGGYIAMFNLGLILSDMGHRARFILLDQVTLDKEELRKNFGEYQGLEDLLARTEVVCAGDRSKKVPVSPEDVFMATTWWTAYVAHKAAEELGKEKFVYFIQEYEPFCHPRGTYCVLAENSYTLPHLAIFSTGFLQEYFRDNRIGIYTVPGRGEEDGFSFKHPVHIFTPDPASLQKRRKKKLIFYARPEEHAARNMFELGVMALVKAIEKGVFPLEEWEFLGIGSIGPAPDYPLARGKNLVMIPRLPVNEYYALLPHFDLGLSLMATPHPSLPPLDFAAAGCIVVTNSCLNKTAGKLMEISPNIITVDPTLEDLVAGLKSGVARVPGIGERIRNADLSWPRTWEDAFGDEQKSRFSGFIASLSSR